MLYKLTSLDPLLFPFRPNLGKHDATIYMLQRVYACLDSNSCIMGITFDFSRLLNTIHLLLLREKLRKNISKQVNYHTVYWLADTQAAVCETGQCNLVQYRSSTGDCAVSIPAHLALVLCHLSTSLNFLDFIFSGELLLHCALLHCAANILKKCKSICKEKYYNYTIWLLCVTYFLIVETMQEQKSAENLIRFVFQQNKHEKWKHALNKNGKRGLV